MIGCLLFGVSHVSIVPECVVSQLLIALNFLVIYSILLRSIPVSRWPPELQHIVASDFFAFGTFFCVVD